MQHKIWVIAIKKENRSRKDVKLSRKLEELNEHVRMRILTQMDLKINKFFHYLLFTSLAATAQDFLTLILHFSRTKKSRLRCCIKKKFQGMTNSLIFHATSGHCSKCQDWIYCKLVSAVISLWGRVKFFTSNTSNWVWAQFLEFCGVSARRMEKLHWGQKSFVAALLRFEAAIESAERREKFKAAF